MVVLIFFPCPNQTTPLSQATKSPTDLDSTRQGAELIINKTWNVDNMMWHISPILPPWQPYTALLEPHFQISVIGNISIFGDLL